MRQTRVSLRVIFLCWFIFVLSFSAFSFSGTAVAEEGKLQTGSADIISLLQRDPDTETVLSDVIKIALAENSKPLAVFAIRKLAREYPLSQPVGTLAEKLQRLEPKEIPSIYENYCKSPNA